MDYLILVNKEHSLPKDYVPFDLVEIHEPSGIKLDENYVNKLNRVVYQSFKKMQLDALKKGYELIIDSTYRTFEYQKFIFDECVKSEGLEHAKKYVALPGTSEHHTGLAVDITVRRNNEILVRTNDDDPEMKWLRHNSYKYGFILRYPKGKESITGFGYEHWHYRYVGKEAAKIIYKNRLVLEEYISNS